MTLRGGSGEDNGSGGKDPRGGGAFRRRIMDMGITKGSEIYVRKVAPLGDPVEITIRGYELSLRKADADSIDVTVKEGI